jgi:putative endonuclease
VAIRGDGPIATTRDAGARWEDAALHHLTRHGLELVTRNFICRFGEIDLVLRERGILVFAEVRYRGDVARGDGTVSVGPAKRAKLTRAAALYLQAHPHLAALPCRFDVVGCGGSLAQPVFEWTRAAFEAF